MRYKQTLAMLLLLFLGWS